jgi:hypothetical protein
MLSAVVSAGEAARPRGDNLFSLANSIAAAVGGAIAIEDNARRVLAHSTLDDQVIDDVRRRGILGRKVPEQRDNDEAYRRVRGSTCAVNLHVVGDELPRLAVAIRSGGEVLGSIWAVEGPNGLERDAAAAMEHGARLAAVALLQERLSRRACVRGHDELAALLSGSERARALALDLGLSGWARYTVVSLSADTPSEPKGDEAGALQLLEFLSLSWSGVHDVRLCVNDKEVLALFRTVSADHLALKPVVSAALARAYLLQLSVRAGISRPVTDIAEAPVAAREARLVRESLGGRSDGSVAVFDDVEARIVLREVQHSLDRGTTPVLSRLRHMRVYDQANGSDYEQTLRVYLDEMGSVTAAARALHVHPNTLRYRLIRMEELFGVDLADASERLALHLQVHRS